MTAEWEQKLLDIEKGSYKDSAFMAEIEEMINRRSFEGGIDDDKQSCWKN